MGPFPRRRACYGMDVKLQRGTRMIFAETCHSVESCSAVTLPFCAGCVTHTRLICPQMAKYLTFF